VVISTPNRDVFSFLKLWPLYPAILGQAIPSASGQSRLALTRMGLSLSGAKSRVQRSREKLKQLLLGCCHLEFDRWGNVVDYKHKSNECKFC